MDNGELMMPFCIEIFHYPFFRTDPGGHASRDKVGARGTVQKNHFFLYKISEFLFCHPFFSIYKYVTF